MNGIFESDESTYDDEKELFETRKEIKVLIENLETSSNARKNKN
jgi:hypothetical protein